MSSKLVELLTGKEYLLTEHVAYFQMELTHAQAM